MSDTVLDVSGAPDVSEARDVLDISGAPDVVDVSGAPDVSGPDVLDVPSVGSALSSCFSSVPQSASTSPPYAVNPRARPTLTTSALTTSLCMRSKSRCEA